MILSANKTTAWEYKWCVHDFCLTDNATYEATISYGLGDDTVTVDTYHIVYGDTEVYFAVTADTCMPVAMDTFGPIPGSSCFLLHSPKSLIRVYRYKVCLFAGLCAQSYHSNIVQSPLNERCHVSKRVTG